MLVDLALAAVVLALLAIATSAGARARVELRAARRPHLPPITPAAGLARGAACLRGALEATSPVRRPGRPDAVVSRTRLTVEARREPTSGAPAPGMPRPRPALGAERAPVTPTAPYVILDELEVARAELVDATGSVALDWHLCDVRLIASSTSTRCSIDELAAARPDLAKRARALDPRALEVLVEEWLVPPGATVLVSGVATPGASPAGYRGGPGLVVGAGADAPLLVSTFGHRGTRRELARGARAFGLTSFVAALAAAVVAVAALGVRAWAG